MYSREHGKSLKLRPVSLVTGAAGFLGSHVVDRLLQKGHYVVGVDNLCTGDLENLAQAFALGQDNFLFIRSDVVKEFSWPDLQYTFIWHLASPASPVDYRRLSLETLLVNSTGTHKMLDLAMQNGAKFLLASTSEVYGDPLVHPQPETYWGNVNPAGERACYDESKRFAESLTLEYHRRYNLDVRVVRLFNTYGPRMGVNDGRVVPNFICQMLQNRSLTVYGNGMQTRSFAYVEDTVEGILRAMFYPKTSGEIINIGNQEEYTVLEFARLIAALGGLEPDIIHQPLPSDDPARRCPVTSKAKKLLDWKPTVPLEQGIKQTINYLAKKLGHSPDHASVHGLSPVPLKTEPDRQQIKEIVV